MAGLTTVIEQILDISADAPAEFLIVYARFEYALKRGGFLRNRRGHAEADWDAFANLLATSETTEVLRRGQVLLYEPPKIEGVEDGRIAWIDAPHAGGASEIERLLVFVRRVRNNLFHGGKFPPDQPHEYARDRRLVEASIATLEALLRHPLAADVRQFFFDGVQHLDAPD